MGRRGLSEDPRGVFMREAVRLAGRGLGAVEPNPMVGAVLVQGGRVVARGWHKRFGGPHAEVELLRECAKAGIDPGEGELYVTLEPCCHYGKTPPCVDALIEAGVKRVVAAMEDPNPLVGGQGIAKLCEAGVVVEVGLCRDGAERLNRPYLKRVRTGLPWTMAKWAQTLDGKLATARGESKWISGEASRRWVHRLRGRVDAVMVGIGTVLADDPQLTARGVTVRRVARRVVVDPRMRFPLEAKLLATVGEGPVTLAVQEETVLRRQSDVKRLEDLGVEIVPLPQWAGDAALMDLSVLLRHLVGQHGATNVVVEGGGKLIGSMLRQGLVDEVFAFVGPKILGDAEGVAAVAGLSPATLVEATGLRLDSLRRLGGDVLLEYGVLPATGGG